jgi:hypothetical protein
LFFKGGNIEIEFDEFVQLKDLQNQLIVTPLLKENPTVQAAKRRVTIKIPDSLLSANTTYNISLGNAIQDIRESNPYPNFNFTFSTGGYFDSLSLKGRVYDAATGKPDTSCIILLYKGSVADSQFTKEKPMYVRKSESGSFLFKHLPNLSFTIFALHDINNNLIYDQANEQIAFYEKLVTPSDSATIILYSFKDTTVADTSSSRKRLQRPVAAETGKVKQSIRLTINADTTSGSKRSFDIMDSLRIRFNQPIQSIANDRIRLYQDSILDASTILILDTISQTLKIATTWSEDALYRVYLLKGWTSDSAGVSAPADSFSFRTKRKSDYGILSLQCTVQENDILELLQQDKVIARKPLNDTLISFPMLLPGNYQLRLLHDKNGNGIWDTGHLFPSRLLPEITDHLSTPISIKANWENKFDLREGIRSKPKSKR